MSIDKIKELDLGNLNDHDVISASIGCLVNLLVEKKLITVEEYYDTLQTGISLAIEEKKEK